MACLWVGPLRVPLPRGLGHPRLGACHTQLSGQVCTPRNILQLETRLAPHCGQLAAAVDRTSWIRGGAAPIPVAHPKVLPEAPPSCRNSILSLTHWQSWEIHPARAAIAMPSTISQIPSGCQPCSCWSPCCSTCLIREGTTHLGLTPAGIQSHVAMGENPGTRMVPLNSWRKDVYSPSHMVMIAFDPSPYLRSIGHILQFCRYFFIFAAPHQTKIDPGWLLIWSPLCGCLSS